MQTRPTVALATKNGRPLLAELKIRPSEAMPSRLKVTLAVPTAEGFAALTPDGLQELPGLKVAKGQDEMALCPEFRIELN